MTAMIAETLHTPHPLTGARILRLNALTGIVSGTILVLAAPVVAEVLGLVSFDLAIPVAQVVGVGLIAFAALLLWITRRPIPPAMMLAIRLVDAAWVTASVALLVSRVLPLSTAGVWIVALQADVIALIAALELWDWWHQRPGGPERPTLPAGQTP